MTPVTLLTCTRNRSLCFSLLEKWIGAQTLKPDRWLVINDSPGGMRDYKYTLGQEVHYRRVKKGEGPSICENLKAALAKVQEGQVVIAEDDDWYHPEYIQTVVQM